MEKLSNYQEQEMDNLNFLQLIMSDGVLSLELLAFFAIGFYLMASIAAFPVSLRHLSRNALAPQRRETLSSTGIQIGFKFATLVGVGAVVSPPRTWLRQNTKSFS